MANVTLVIDEELLKRARIRALEEGTSVNSVVRDFLGQYASRSPVAALQSFLAAARRSTAGSGSAGRSWTRADVYEDRIGR